MVSRDPLDLPRVCDEATGARGLFWFASHWGVCNSIGEDGGEVEFGRGSLPFSSLVPVPRLFAVVWGEVRFGVSLVFLVGLVHCGGGDLAAGVFDFLGTWGGSLAGTAGGESSFETSTTETGMEMGTSSDP